MKIALFLVFVNILVCLLYRVQFNTHKTIYTYICTHIYISGHMTHVHLESILKSLIHFLLLTMPCNTQGNSNYAHFRGKKTP